MIAEIFLRFLLLGIVSFGGPVAHIGYFRQTFVIKLAWLNDKQFANFLALCQFLPGPASSQLGFAIGYYKAGLMGAITAFLGFTLPSFLLLFAVASLTHSLYQNAIFIGVIHGMKLLAVVVVAHAVWGMFRQFCQTLATKTLMVLSAVIMLLAPFDGVQFVLIILAGAYGWLTAKQSEVEANHRFELISIKWRYLAIFIIVLIYSLLVFEQQSLAGLFARFYQVGALVFGGGHVVLPLLQNTISELITEPIFLTGYSLAQAVPGPMFTLASFLGAEIWLEAPFLGALAATLAIFLPGFLLLLTCLRGWHELVQLPVMTQMIAAINATVVGFLLAALYTPVFRAGVLSATDMALVTLGFAALGLYQYHIIVLVLFFALVGGLLVIL